VSAFAQDVFSKNLANFNNFGGPPSKTGDQGRNRISLWTRLWNDLRNNALSSPMCCKTILAVRRSMAWTSLPIY